MISNPDGSIILTTAVDTTGIDRSTNSMMKKYDKLIAKAKDIEKQMRDIAAANDEIIRSGVQMPTDTTGKGGLETVLTASQQAQYDKNEAAYQRLKDQLADVNNEAQTLGATIQESANKSSAGVVTAASGFEKLGKRIAGLAKRVFIFSVITKAFRALRTAFSDFIKNDAKLNASFQSIKDSFSVIGNSIMETLRPALQWLLDKLAYFANILAQVFASWLGKSADQMKRLGKETKKTTGALAAFDEVNTLSIKGDGGAGGSAATQFAAKTQDELAIIGTVTGLAMLGLGIILCLTGASIPVGLFLMVTGATIAYKSMTANWDTLNDKTKTQLEKIANISGVALIAIGIALMLTGVGFGVGLAMVIAGGYAIYKSYQLDPTKFREAWKEVGDELDKEWGKMTGRSKTAIKGLTDSVTALIRDWKDKAWKNVWIDIANIIISIFNIVLDLIQTVIKGIVFAMSWLVSQITKLTPKSWGLQFDVSWSDMPATFNIPKIPRMASGGIVPYATIAELGENGKEAVLPLENNTGWMDTLADRVVERLGGGYGGRIEVPVIIDGREVARANREAEGRMGTQTVYGRFANAY